MLSQNRPRGSQQRQCCPFFHKNHQVSYFGVCVLLRSCLAVSNGGDSAVYQGDTGHVPCLRSLFFLERKSVCTVPWEPWDTPLEISMGWGPLPLIELTASLSGGTLSRVGSRTSILVSLKDELTQHVLVEPAWVCLPLAESDWGEVWNITHKLSLPRFAE